MPRARGSASRINKKTSHVTLVLAEKEVKAKKVKKVSEKKEVKKSTTKKKVTKKD